MFFAIDPDKPRLNAAGWMFNPITRRFETGKISRAVRLREFFDKSARDFTNCTLCYETPWPDSPLIGGLREFQRAGVRFALNRNHSYIAFEQGLGKTPTFIAITNVVALPTLIICPPFLVGNWKREIRLWSERASQASLEAGKEVDQGKVADIIILPDTLLDREGIQQFVCSHDFGLLGVDEAHRYKNLDAKRTQRLFELAKAIPKVVCLSGTPMPNRPIELFPVLSNLAANTINHRNRHQFGVKFCNAFEHKHGWDYTGASNLKLLRHKVHGTFMKRVLKKDVLHELKPKEERVIVLSSKLAPEIRSMDRKIRAKHGIRRIAEVVGGDKLGDIAKYRSALASQKVLPVIDYVRDILENGTDRILLLGHHTDFILQVCAALKRTTKRDPLLIYGKTLMKDRDKIIAKFQNSDVRILVAQIQTMVGVNLTKANRVIFGEFDWSPAVNEQAIDRTHRIGQKDSVTVDYLVLEHTIEELMLDRIMNKREVQNYLINRKGI